MSIQIGSMLKEDTLSEFVRKTKRRGKIINDNNLYRRIDTRI